MNMQRDCNGCTACCTGYAVTSLGKPAHHDCERCVPGVGCNDYEHRPEDCIFMRCAYLKGLRGDETWPLRSGFIEEEHFDSIWGHVWTLCEWKPGVLQSPLAKEEIAWALGQGMIVATEAVDGKATIRVPSGRGVSITARQLALSGGAELIFEGNSP